MSPPTRRLSQCSHRLVSWHRTSAYSSDHPWTLACTDRRDRTGGTPGMRLRIRWRTHAARGIHGMSPVPAIDALASCLLRDGGRLRAVMVLKTARSGDRPRGFESCALHHCALHHALRFIRPDMQLGPLRQGRRPPGPASAVAAGDHRRFRGTAKQAQAGTYWWAQAVLALSRYSTETKVSRPCRTVTGMRCKPNGPGCAS